MMVGERRELETIKIFEREEHTWDKDGDCIGLGAAYGRPGNYVQSDI